MKLPDLTLQNKGRWRGLSSTRRREEMAGWLFASPWIIGFIVFTAGPMLYSLVMSFTNYDLFNVRQFVGLANYRRLLTDSLVPHALKVTTWYALVSVPLGLVLGLFIALLLNQKIRFLSLFRTVYYLPSVLPSVAVMFLWSLVFNRTFGLLNYVLSLFGIAGPNWLGDPDYALWALIIMSLWGIGGGMLVYLAGLQGIPTELYEAARIDGANAFRSFVNITLPLLSPVIFFNLIMGIINALQVFNEAFILTGGGPINATYFFVLHIYYKAFQDFQMGYSSTLAWVLFAYIGVLTVIVFRLSVRKVHYEDVGER